MAHGADRLLGPQGGDEPALFPGAIGEAPGGLLSPHAFDIDRATGWRRSGRYCGRARKQDADRLRQRPHNGEAR